MTAPLMGGMAKLKNSTEPQKPLAKGEFRCSACQTVGKDLSEKMTVLGWIVCAIVLVLSFIVWGWIFEGFFWRLILGIVGPLLFYKLYAVTRWNNGY